MGNPVHTGKVKCKDLDEMVRIVAGLAARGVQFDAMISDGEWTIFIQGA
jgi:hypothetical protein